METMEKETYRRDLSGTVTEQNLHTALSAEAQAYLRYKWFENMAKNDGFVEVSELFRDIASNEMEHAEIWFKYLGGWGATEQNLHASKDGEHFEWSSLYSKFEKKAREEGFFAIADLFQKVASIEKEHEEKYGAALKSLQKGDSFSSNSAETKWICINCGFVYTGKEPPRVCPTCSYPQGYFKKKP